MKCKFVRRIVCVFVFTYICMGKCVRCRQFFLLACNVKCRESPGGVLALGATSKGSLAPVVRAPRCQSPNDSRRSCTPVRRWVSQPVSQSVSHLTIFDIYRTARRSHFVNVSNIHRSAKESPVGVFVIIQVEECASDTSASIAPRRSI